MYKLLVTDLDGTLLDDHGELPQENKQYIRKLMDSGMHVALSSGRSLVSLDKYEGLLGLYKPGCYGICLNGGIVYDVFTKEVISDTRMSRETALELIENVRRAPGFADIGLGIYLGAHVYVEQLNERMLDYAEKAEIELIHISSFSDITQGVTKILMYGDNKLLQNICEYSREFTAGKCLTLFSRSSLFEFLPLESGKEHGLRVLAQNLGIHTSETIAVGDQENDVGMLTLAGLGVAVANAVDSAKSAADYVSQADNNGSVIKEIAQRFLGM